MSELLWVKVPPPRVAKESTLTFAVAAAIAIYAVPVVTAQHAEGDSIPVELVDLPNDCCFCRHLPDEAELADEARISDRFDVSPWHVDLGYVGVLGSVDGSLRPTPALAIETGELALEDGIWSWRVRAVRGLVAEMQPPLHRSQLSTFSILAQGSLDRSVVRRYLKRQGYELARCYDPLPSLQLGQGLRGDRDPAVQFLIERDGRVVQVIPITSSPELATCLEQTIKTLTFPRSDGLTQVHVPLHYGTIEASAGVFVR